MPPRATLMRSAAAADFADDFAALRAAHDAAAPLLPFYFYAFAADAARATRYARRLPYAFCRDAARVAAISFLIAARF